MVSHKVVFSFPRGEEVSSEELMHVHSAEIDTLDESGVDGLAAEDLLFGGLACVWSRHPYLDKDISRRKAASILTLQASIVSSQKKNPCDHWQPLT